MAVNNLLERGLGIKDLHINTLEISPVSESMQRYEELKSSPFYDREKKKWNSLITEKQELYHPTDLVADQLFGIVVASRFDKKNVLEEYENLKKVFFYRNDRKVWDNYLNQRSTQQAFIGNIYTKEFLLHILVESVFNKEEAKVQFEKLKQTGLYDNKYKQWNKGVRTDDHSNLLSDRESSVQLLGIFTEAQFDKKAAQKNYDVLKSSDLYNDDNQQWYQSMEANQYRNTTHRNASGQLLGVLVDGLFDQETAQEHYTVLKNSVLYDQKKHQWNRSAFEDHHYRDNNRIIFDQFLGVLIEDMLEKKQTEFIAPQAPIPEMRRF